MAKTIKAPRGTEDMMPQDWRLWRRIEETAREVFELAGYYEIRTPVFEDTNLFVRSIGEVTDIVEKEMYTFREGDSSGLTLRPENTAAVMRAYVQYELHKTKKFQKFYYIGPMFRKERPQAGRLRQFHQMGVEAIGADDPMLDAETIIVAVDMYSRLGLNDVAVNINSIGCNDCRPGFRDILKGRLEEQRGELCGLCDKRMDRNVLRVLDCKEEKCGKIAADLPSIHEHLCPCCATHFEEVKKSLSMSGIDYVVDDHLVRGLDYYSKTVYEITHHSLGARSTICAGGRYDYLVEEIGGPPTGAVGFAAGIEASILALKNAATGDGDNAGPAPDIYAVSISKECKADCFNIVNNLRAAGISADMDFEDRSTKAQMRTANKIGSKMTLIVGPDEIEKGAAKLKNMESGDENEVEIEKMAEFIKELNL